MMRGALKPIERKLLVWRAITKRLFNPQITYIGVTGSCGKTTTTELIGTVLSSQGKCTVQVKRNTTRALAASILSNHSDTKYSVHEVSGAAPGRVWPQTRILRPQIAVITTVGGDHYRNYRSLEAVAAEKGKLAEALPRHGTLILNLDDPLVRAMALRSRASVVTCGTSADADYRAVDISCNWPERLALTVIHQNDRIRIRTKLAGEFWTTSVLAAIACGAACGIDLEACANAVSSFAPNFGRYSIHQSPDGAVYIFDHKATYWTIPSSLEFLKNASAPRKTLVLGTISDYGGAAGQKYRNVARDALQVADRVIFVGPQSRHISKLREGNLGERLLEFRATYQAARFMALQPAIVGELILVRGSIGTDHLERIFLSHTHEVVCWKQGCGVMRVACPSCKHYGTPSPPPSGPPPEAGVDPSGGQSDGYQTAAIPQ